MPRLTRLLFFVPLLVASPALAQPFGVRITHAGDPARSIAVSWNSPTATEGSVLIGTTPGTLDRTVAATETFAIGSDLGTSFTAFVDGLAPATTYHYRVGDPTGRLHPAASAAPFSFRTLPADPCAPMRIVVIGDNRADLDGMGPNILWSDIQDEALAFMPDLFLNTGDMVKNGERIDEWANFVDASEPGMAVVASLTTMGNHDEDDVNGDGALYNRLFALPRNSRTSTEDYYSIDVGPVHLISLNTQFTRPGTTELMEMAAWLDGDLAATTQPYRIVFFHKAVYTRGNHHTGEENGGTINATFVPIFDRHDVDLVFNGHSHDYERFAPSVGVDEAFGGTGRTFPLGLGPAVRAMMMLADGATATSYVVTGGAGAFVAPVADVSCLGCRPFPIPGLCDCDTDVLDLDVDSTVLFDGKHNFVVMDVDGPELRVEAYTTVAGNSDGGERIDAFTIADATWPAGLCTIIPPPMDGGVPTLDGGAAVLDGGVATLDGSASGVDGATSADGGGVRTDSGSARADSGGGGGAASDDGGCGCRVVGRERRDAWLVAFAALFGVTLLVRARRRSRR